MQSVTVATETQRRIRQRELAAADEKEAQERGGAKEQGVHAGIFKGMAARQGAVKGQCGGRWPVCLLR